MYREKNSPLKNKYQFWSLLRTWKNHLPLLQKVFTPVKWGK